MYLQYKNLEVLYHCPPVYFRCKYEPTNVYAAEGRLPDFGDKSAGDIFKEMFDEEFGV